MEGHIFIRGDIGADFSQYVESQLQAPEIKNASELIVHISSRGGSVYEGYTAYHLLKAMGKPITAIIEGQAQSMATFIAMAAKKVIMLTPSVFMIHNPSSGIEGDSNAMRNGAAELAKIEDEMAQAYAAKTKLPIDQIKEMMRNETSMNAEEAKKLGFVDEIRQQLKAVAYGKTMKKKEDGVIAKFIKQLKAAAGEPVALDVQLMDGTVLSIDAPNEDSFIGAKATIAGAAAPDGDYVAVPDAEDGNSQTGDTITVKGGVVTAVTEPATAAGTNKIAALEAEIAKLKQAQQVKVVTETAEQKAARLEKELEAIKAKEAAAQEAAAKQADEKKALEEAEKLIESLKKKTAGNPNPPSSGNMPMRTPIGMKRSEPNARNLDAGRTFIAQNPSLQYLKRYYEPGFFQQYEEGGPLALSIMEPNFTFTYPGILTDDLFFKPTLSSPALSDMFTIDQGISFQKQYNVVPGLSKILKPYIGCATTNSNSSRVQIGTATLVTKEFRMQEAFCKDDFTQQLTGVYNNLAQDWLKTGEKSFDPAGTPIDKAIMYVLADALRRDVFTRATLAADQSSSVDYNQFSGLWDRLIDSSGQSNYCVVRANSSIFGGTALGTGTLAAGIALTNLELVYQQSNNLLKENFDKAMFWVTGSVYDNYVQSLVGTGNVSNLQFQNVTDGPGTGRATWMGGITYKGIPIYPVRLWDSALADTNNPFNGTTKHLILLTVKSNHILGLENSADLNNIVSWFEMKDSKRYYRSDMKIGYQYLHCDLQTIAY